MNNGYETALDRTGWGLCHYFLVGICGICSLAEASAFLITLVVTPLLACDLKLEKNDIMTVNGIFSLGMSIGGLFVGILADSRGRKCMILVSLIMIVWASKLLAFAHRFFVVCFAIFLLGFGTAGNNVALRVYLIECLPARRRGTCMVLLDLLWVLGYLASVATAWSLVPSIVRSLGNDFRPSSWRVLAALGGAISLTMACVAGLLPPSPRYLLYRRKPEEALAQLQCIYAINNSQHADRYPACELEGCIQADEDNDTRPNSTINNVSKFGVKTWRKVTLIFRPPYARITLLSLISRLLLFPGFVWLALWKVHLSDGADHSLRKPTILTNGHDSSICDFDSADIVGAFLYTCQEANISHFEYFTLLSTSYVIGETLLFFGIDFLGRRLSLLTSGMIGGTSVVALLFAHRAGAQLLLSLLFLAAYSIIYTTTGIMILENYPTSVRGTVVGLTLVVPHVAAFLVKFFARVNCTGSTYVAAGLIIGGTLAALPIPDLTRAPMNE